MVAIKRLLLIPHIKVHNANALSSPFTIGFPAMTAFLGASHALQRHLNNHGFTDCRFNATAVVIHECNLQTHRGRNDFVSSIIGTANPLDKSGSRSAFIEEARCHLDVSLVVEYEGVAKENEKDFIDKITHLLHAKMKLAGGDIIDFSKPACFKVEENNQADVLALTRRLMPGYAIIERRDLMQVAMDNGMDAMDALLDYLMVHHRSEINNNDEVQWHKERRTKGWIIPIASGFQAVSELAVAKNQRDEDIPHCFAESLVTLGEFIMPYKIQSIDEILWHYHVETEHNLYLCQQTKQVNTISNFFE